MHYDGLNLAEGELSLGVEFLEKLKQKAKFSFLSANVYLKESNELVGREFLIKDFSDFKVGIIGLVSPDFFNQDFLIKEKLVIGGKQPERLKMLVKNLRLEKEVIFTGYINKNDLPLFYNVAEAFIFPSFHESFGMPIIEAMACGCPVITSNVFSMPEVAGDAAVLVNPYSVDEIANAMYTVLTDDGLREKLRKRGLKRAKQFSWRKCAEEHLKVYRMVSEE